MKAELDDFSLALVAALMRDGRASQVELSKQVGLSPTACGRRQKALEEDGVIAGYRAVLQPKALGMGITAMVQIALDSQREEALRAFETAIERCRSVVSCHLMSGSDDYRITVVARDLEDFEQIHKSELSRLPHVSRIQSSFAMRQVLERPAALPLLTRARRKKR